MAYALLCSLVKKDYAPYSLSLLFSLPFPAAPTGSSRY
jgi:hypothetical protein